MGLCEDCGRNEASVGCLLCRRNLCDGCFEGHMSRIADDMDEGFAPVGREQDVADQPIVCEICGLSVESQKKDEHLFEVHGITI